MWIDTHCHLDAPEFAHDVQTVREHARHMGVQLCVLPSVQRSDWARTQALAHQTGDVYALGIHPLYVPQAQDSDVQALDEALGAALDGARGDARLVAVGEIGLDFFEPALCEPAMRARQQHFFEAQVQLAKRHGLPVIVHTRRAVDAVLQVLRRAAAGGPPIGGVAHAFGGSAQQARAYAAQGLALGVGGAITHSRATRLRQVVREVAQEGVQGVQGVQGMQGLHPRAADIWVAETDAPDMVPQWLYRTAQQRADGHLPQQRNSPAELPRIAQCVADACGWPLAQFAQSAQRATLQALPRLAPFACPTP